LNQNVDQMWFSFLTHQRLEVQKLDTADDMVSWTDDRRDYIPTTYIVPLDLAQEQVSNPTIFEFTATTPAL
jgi:hypothetical protein